MVSTDYDASWFYRRDKASSSLENQIDKALKVNRQRSKQKGSLATNCIHATFVFAISVYASLRPPYPAASAQLPENDNAVNVTEQRADEAAPPTTEIAEHAAESEAAAERAPKRLRTTPASASAPPSGEPEGMLRNRSKATDGAPH